MLESAVSTLADMAHAKRTTSVLLFLLALMFAIAACSGADAAEVDAPNEADAATTATVADEVDTDDGETVGSTVAALPAVSDNQESHVDAGDLTYDPSEVTEIILEGPTAASDSDDVEVEGGVVTITDEGVYRLSGTLTDGSVIVDAGGDDDVTLVLDAVDITNSTGAAIAFMNADEAVVLLADGSSNRLTDGAVYTFPDAETDEPNATLYSSADLAVAGSGELTVTANYNDGITSKDGLVIDEATINVTAVDDGIRGKDYVIVQGGKFVIDADGDGITSDNDEDEERGYVLVAGGDLTILAGDDGIQAATDVLITDGTIDATAGAASGTGRALQGDVMVSIAGGELTATAVDDAIHSNNAVTIDGGTLTLAAGDDGIHGDYLVTINGGTVTVTDSFEGIEAEVIEINDGVVNVTSDDDGLNVASAEATATTPTADPTTGRPARPGRGADEAVGEHYVYINGGTISITVTDALAEQGDGIDANGHIVMTGGVVSISGATDTRNSALDYSGGSFEMTGGLLIGTNIDGRNSEGVGVGSSQASLYVVSNTVMEAGTVVHIESAEGDSLVTFEPANDYSVIVFSSPDLVAGESYDVHLGGTVSGGSDSGLYDSSEGADGELVGSVIATV